MVIEYQNIVELRYENKLLRGLRHFTIILSTGMEINLPHALIGTRFLNGIRDWKSIGIHLFCGPILFTVLFMLLLKKNLIQPTWQGQLSNLIQLAAFQLFILLAVTGLNELFFPGLKQLKTHITADLIQDFKRYEANTKFRSQLALWSVFSLVATFYLLSYFMA